MSRAPPTLLRATAPRPRRTLTQIFRIFFWMTVARGGGGAMGVHGSRWASGLIRGGETVPGATATAGECKPQDVANVLWALATMEEKADRGLLEAQLSTCEGVAGRAGGVLHGTTGTKERSTGTKERSASLEGSPAFRACRQKWRGTCGPRGGCLVPTPASGRRIRLPDNS